MQHHEGTRTLYILHSKLYFILVLSSNLSKFDLINKKRTSIYNIKSVFITYSMKYYILEVHLFEFIDVNIFFIKLGQSKRGFTKDKAKVNYYNLEGMY